MEQNDLLPKSNQSLIQKRLKNFKKSLIRTMAGLGTAAILLTGTGCDQTIKPDTTNPIIDKETSQMPTLEKYKEKEYTSSIGKSLLTSNEAKEKENEFNTWYKENEVGGLDFLKMFNDLDLHPLCYDFFRDYYGGNITNEEINKKAKIACQFVDEENNLYVQYYFSNKTNGLNDDFDDFISKFNIVLLKFDLSQEIAQDLINSGLSQNNIKNLTLLQYIVNNFNYEVVSKEICNSINRNFNIRYIDKEKQSKSVGQNAVSISMDLENNIKNIYILSPLDTSSGYCLWIVKKNMSEKELKTISMDNNEDYLEYPSSSSTRFINIYDKDNLQEGTIDIEKKNVYYIGDYYDSLYWGVDYTVD